MLMVNGLGGSYEHEPLSDVSISRACTPVFDCTTKQTIPGPFHADAQRSADEYDADDEIRLLSFCTV